jgi:TonB family protein
MPVTGRGSGPVRFRSETWRTWGGLAMAVALSAPGANVALATSFPSIDRLPEVITRAPAEYPRAAREAGLEGTVQVNALVDTSGRVIDTRILSSIPELDEAAVACVREWTFRPVTSNGHRINCWVAVPVRFALDDHEQDAAPFDGGRPPRPRRYFVNADSSDIVELTRVAGDSLYFESPGEWAGRGVLLNGTYRGEFTYGDAPRDRSLRRARGTHQATLTSDGVYRVVVTWRNRKLPPALLRWTPLDRAGDRMVISREKLSEIPVDHLQMMQHPTWPPPGAGADAKQLEPPVWPPVRSKPDAAIVPAVKDSVRR